MEIELTPDIITAPIGAGITSHAQLREAAEAMFNSAQYLQEFGRPSPLTADGADTARKVFQEKRPVSAVTTTATAVHLKALLTEYDVQIAQTAAQLRTYVTNSLLEEAAPGSKNRIRALELLGKISEVGLFTERTEVTVRHQTTAELEQKVRDKIAALTGRTKGISDIEDIKPNDVSMDDISRKINSITDTLLAPQDPC